MKLMKTEKRQKYLGKWSLDHIARGEAQGEARGEARGEIKGEVRSILKVLEARGLEVPEEVRAEIGACTDLDRLDAWLRAAATATSARDLLAPDSG
jgi:hypothetical protein